MFLSYVDALLNCQTILPFPACFLVLFFLPLSPYSCPGSRVLTCHKLWRPILIVVMILTYDFDPYFIV